MDDPAAHLDALTPSPSCAAVRGELDSWLDHERDRADGAVTLIDSAAIAAHLAHCAPCRRVVQQLRAQRTRLRRLAERAATQADERASEALRARVARLLAG